MTTNNKNGTRWVKFWPVFITVITMAGFFYVLSYRVGDLEVEARARDNKVGANVTKINIVETDVSNIKDDIREIKDDVKFLRQIFTPAQ